MKPRIGGKYCNQFDLNQQVYKVEKVEENKDLVWLKSVLNESYKAKVPLSSFSDRFWKAKK